MERSYLPVLAEFIHRPRIDMLIEKGLKYSLVLVIAGPGYGKTLSLARYMKTAPVRLVWLRVFGGRARPDEFWEDFVRAAKRELPQCAERLEALGFPADPCRFEQFRQAVAEVVAIGERLVLVVDRYEQIVSGNVVRFLDNLIDVELPNVTIFLLCGAKLSFAETLPAMGQFRITDGDLAFNAEETRMMLAHYNIDTSPAIVDKVMRETGGWPYGLRLICADNPKNPAGFPGKMAVQMSADLYEQHFFRNYPQAIQNQLIRVSVLPLFSMEMVRLGMEDYSSELYNLLMQHAFAGYDYTTEAFKFHPMYREFLRHKQALVSPGDVAEMRAFAGRWFVEHGRMQEAMDCFWEIGDYDGFLEVLYRLPRTQKPANVTNQILQRLLQVPRSYVRQVPEVDFCIAFMYLNAGDVNQAKERLRALAEQLEGAPDREAQRLLLGDTYAALSDIALYQNEGTGLEWMQKAYELIPDGSRIQDAELMAVGNNSVFFLPGKEAGLLERIVDQFLAYAGYADRVKNGCGYGIEYLFAGEAAYCREEMESAATLFNSAMMKAVLLRQHDVICNALWGLCRIEAYNANYKNALVFLEQLIEYVNGNNLTELYELRDCAVAWFYIRVGDLGKVPAWFGEMMPDPDEMLISLGRNRLMVAYYLFSKGEWMKTQAVILQLEAMLQNKGRWAEKVSLYVLQALCYLAQGDFDFFEKAFREAYDRVYDNNIKVMLSEFGKEMMSAVDQLRRMDAGGYDMEWLDEVYKDALSFAKRLQMMRSAHHGGGQTNVRSAVALTVREREALHYLAQGLNQEEVGRLMGISVNAVKKHTSKIYNKLGAANRADAIHIATISGLVDAINN